MKRRGPCADDGTIKWNHVLGTMIRGEFDLLKKNIQCLVDEANDRIEWLQFEVDNMTVRYVPEIKEALRFNNVDPSDIRDDPIKFPKDRVVPPIRDLDDADASTRMIDAKEMYLDAVKWNKEMLEFKDKFTYDLKEQLVKEIADIQIHNALIPQIFAEIEEMFSDLLSHNHMAFTLNRRMDEPASTPIILTDGSPSTLGGPDLVARIPGPIPAGTPPSEQGPGGATGGTGGGALKVGVTAQSVFITSFGGVISGGATAINDSRFQVFDVGQGQTGTYTNATISTDRKVVILQFVPAAVDLSIQMSLLGTLKLYIQDAIISSVSTSFKLTSTVTVEVTATPGSFAGDGNTHDITLEFKTI